MYETISEVENEKIQFYMAFIKKYHYTLIYV